MIPPNVCDLTLQEIEEELLITIQAKAENFKKTWYIVMMTFGTRLKDSDVSKVNVALNNLVQRPDIECAGDVEKWQWSEIRYLT